MDDEPPSDSDENTPLGTFLSESLDDVDIEVDSVKAVRELREDG